MYKQDLILKPVALRQSQWGILEPGKSNISEQGWMLVHHRNMYSLGKIYKVTTLSLLITNTKWRTANLDKKKYEKTNDAGGSLIKEGLSQK